MNEQQRQAQVNYIKSLEATIDTAQKTIGALTIARQQDRDRYAAEAKQIDGYIKKQKDEVEKLTHRIVELEAELKDAVQPISVGEAVHGEDNESV